MKPRRKRGARAEAAPSDGMRIDYVPVDEVSRWPANPKRHDEAGIADSIDRFGYVAPLLLDETSGRIVAGHGRLDALQARQAAGGAPPGRVRVDARGRWLVPVVRGLSFASDDEADAYLIADNALSERGGWDHAALLARVRALAAGAGLRGTGYDDEAVRELAAKVAALTPKPAPGDDDVPEPPAVAVSRRGDLWLFDSGKGHAHRLLTGDSTKADDVARVMAGEKAALCFTSPPYAQQRDYGAKIDDWDGLMCGVFGNLPLADDGQVLVNLGLVHRDGEWWPYWDGWIDWMREQGWKRFGWYVWDQLSGIPGEWAGRLAPSHEWVFHFCKGRPAIRKTIPCAMAGLMTSHARPTSSGEAKQRPGLRPVQPLKVGDSVARVGRCSGGQAGHPAPFPVGLSVYFVSPWAGSIYEPFSGSGTQIIAAEQLGRRCFAVEIEPRYVDCAVTRWERMTGAHATLDGTGRTFAEVAAERGVKGRG